MQENQGDVQEVTADFAEAANIKDKGHEEKAKFWLQISMILQCCICGSYILSGITSILLLSLLQLIPQWEGEIGSVLSMLLILPASAFFVFAAIRSALSCPGVLLRIFCYKKVDTSLKSEDPKEILIAIRILTVISFVWSIGTAVLMKSPTLIFVDIVALVIMLSIEKKDEIHLLDQVFAIILAMSIFDPFECFMCLHLIDYVKQDDQHTDHMVAKVLIGTAIKCIPIAIFLLRTAYAS